MRVEKADNGDTVAVFRALQETIEVLDCAGDRIAVGYNSGKVLHLSVPLLAGE